MNTIVRYTLSLAAVLALHGYLLFVFHPVHDAQPLPSGERLEKLDVSIVETAPVEQSVVSPSPASVTEQPESIETPPPPATPPSPQPVAEEQPPPPPQITESIHKEKPKPAAPAQRAKPAERPPSASPVLTPKNPSGALNSRAGPTAALPPTAPRLGPATNIRATYNPKPEYPPDARQARQQGVVMVAVEVNSQGEATSVSVARSSGFPALDRAAISAVHRWRFDPKKVAGVPVEGRVEVPIRFQL